MLAAETYTRLRNRVFLISALSGMAYILSSPSALPQASQGMGGVSGQQAFNNACRTCHMVKEGDNRLGPNLYKIVGRKAGSLPDYAFSSAMKEADFVWDEEKLDRFIAKPDEVVPGRSSPSLLNSNNARRASAPSGRRDRTRSGRLLSDAQRTGSIAAWSCRP